MAQTPPAPVHGHSGGKSTLKRRTVVVLALALAVAAPAGVLRASCAGRSCERPAQGGRSVPFCSLPDGVRTRLAAGFRESRSPDIFGVTSEGMVADNRSAREGGPVWPSLESTDTRVPIVFAGTGVSGAPIPKGTGLEDVAPTVARIMGVERPHPEVRSGRAMAGVATEEQPRLVLEVVWKGVGSEDLEAARGQWPRLALLMDGGSATMEAVAGSLPLDPAATLTTLGTGGLPKQHGITGALVRNDLGRVVRAWGPGAPPSVIATLADDADKKLGNRPRIGLIAPRTTDRGVIGGPWYFDVDRDDFLVRHGPAQAAASAGGLLKAGYGSDSVPDLLGVVLEGSVGAVDRALGRVVTAATRAAGGSLTTVVTATGPQTGDELISARKVEAALERQVPGKASVVEAAVAGGFFLD